MKPTEAGTDRYSPVMNRPKTPPISAKGNVRQDQQGLAQRAEGREEQEEDQQQRHRHHHRQPRGGPLLVLELAAPGQPVAGRQRHFAGDGGAGFLDEADQVAVADVGLDDDVALGVFTVDLDRAVNPLDPRDLRQRHAAAGGRVPGCAGQRDAQGGKVGRRAAQRLGAAQQHRHPPALVEHGADRTAFEQRLEFVLQVGDVEPEAAGGEPVDADLEVLHAVVLEREGILGAAHAADAGDDLAGQPVEGGEVGAVNLDRQVAAHAGQHFRDAHVDRLGKGEADPREIGHDFAQAVLQQDILVIRRRATRLRGA